MGATDRGSTLARLVDAATSTGIGGSRRPPPGRLDSPRAELALDDLLAGGEEPIPPPAPGRPWTLAKGGSFYRLYDLGELDESERRRVEAEASVGLALGELPGVVPTRAVTRRGEWLLVERPRLPETLADHLAAGAPALMQPEVYADALGAVAHTLQAAHDRGLAHLNLRPERIGLGDPRTGAPKLADFAIGGLEDDPLPDAYVAQECFLGERGPSVDQYALGVIAHDVFAAEGAPAMTDPVRRALGRATATNPADRFASVAEFGDALRAAIATEAPRGLAGRIEALSPAKRAGLGPALVAVLALVAANTASAPGSAEAAASMLLLTTLGAALLGAIVFAAVALATRIRGKRRLLSFRFLATPVVQLALFLAILAIGFHRTSELSDDVFGAALIAFGGCALLSPPRPGRGAALAGAARVWDRRWAWSPLERRAVTAAALIALAALAAAPALAKTLGDDFEYPTVSAEEFSPLSAVWNLRVLLSRDEAGRACSEVMAAAADRDPSLCRQAAGIAAGVQAHEPARRSRWDFAVHGPLEAFRVQELPGLPDHRLWNLLTPDHEIAGMIYTTGPAGKRLIVQLSREPATGMSLHLRQTWLYEVVWNGDEYRVAEYRACALGPPGSGKKPADCIIASTVTRSELSRSLASGGGAPGG